MFDSTAPAPSNVQSLHQARSVGPSVRPRSRASSSSRCAEYSRRSMLHSGSPPKKTWPFIAVSTAPLRTSLTA